MAFTDTNSMVMPVSPMGGNNGGFGGGFGNDWGWIILLLLFAGGGWGNGFGGGFGGGNYDFPWLLTGQQNINTNTNNGFRDAMINDGITSIRDGISGLSTQLCGCCSDMQMAVANGFAGVEMGANARQIANMQTDFALSQQLAQCCCDNRLATANLGSDIAREACATRTNDTQNTQAILNAVNNGVQSIKDQICQDKIDSKNEKIVELQNQLNMATLRESQTAQNAFIREGQNSTMTALVNELRSCPIPSQPVYGSQPIFTCPNNSGCGCGNF